MDRRAGRRGRTRTGPDAWVRLVEVNLTAAMRFTRRRRSRPETLLQPADMAAAVRYAVTAPARACVTEVDLQPARDPDG